MRVREWMTIDPVTVTPQTSMLNARRLLGSHGVRHLPVVAPGDYVVGMISDRDVLLRDDEVTRVLSTLQSDLLAGRYRRIETIMAAPVHVVRADEPVSLAAKLMLRWHVSGLPVVENRRLVGIITTADCLRALLYELDQDRRQRESVTVNGDPDWCKITPMPPGDDRPGRPVAPRPSRAATIQASPAPVAVDDAVARIAEREPARGAKETAGLAG